MNERYAPETPRNRDQDAPHLTPVTPAEDVRTILINRATWGAIIAGVAMSLVTQLLLNMLGIGVGASTLDPGTGDNPEASTFSIVAGIWWTVSGVIAAFLGGHVAGRLSGQPKGSTTGWQGLISWAVATLVVFYLLTSAVGGIVGGAFNQVTKVIGGATEAAAQGDDPFATIQQQITESIGGSGDGDAVRDAAIAAVRSAITGNQAEAEQQQERAAQALAEAREIPIEQARTEVQQYTEQYQQVAQQAREAADTAATAVSTGALVAFVALLLGAIAAWFGGRMGAVDPTVTVSHVDRRLAPRT